MGGIHSNLSMGDALNLLAHGQFKSRFHIQLLCSPLAGQNENMC